MCILSQKAIEEFNILFQPISQKNRATCQLKLEVTLKTTKLFH